MLRKNWKSHPMLQEKRILILKNKLLKENSGNKHSIFFRMRKRQNKKSLDLHINLTSKSSQKALRQNLKKSQYQWPISELIFLMMTCYPDISYPLIKLSQYSNVTVTENITMLWNKTGTKNWRHLFLEKISTWGLAWSSTSCNYISNTHHWS